MTKADLISPEYLIEQRRLHAMPQGYGGKGGKWAPAVLHVMSTYQCWSVLDYGCGQGALGRALLESQRRIAVREYDPAIEGKDGRPSFADLVCCTDVLEHIEPDKLSMVLTHIRTLARKIVFLVVALDPTAKTLSDGRNAHLIQKPPDWWLARVGEAGLIGEPDLPDLPNPLTPEKRVKRWIAVLRP